MIQNLTLEMIPKEIFSLRATMNTDGPLQDNISIMNSPRTPLDPGHLDLMNDPRNLIDRDSLILIDPLILHGHTKVIQSRMGIISDIPHPHFNETTTYQIFIALVSSEAGLGTRMKGTVDSPLTPVGLIFTLEGQIFTTPGGLVEDSLFYQHLVS